MSANFAYLANDIEMINGSEADWVHVDIMDGVFVPNISFGFPVLKYVAKLAEKPLDVHLMIVQPEKFIPEVKALGARIMNVHYEACPHLHRVVQQIRERECCRRLLSIRLPRYLAERYYQRCLYGVDNGGESGIRRSEIYSTYC